MISDLILAQCHDSTADALNCLNHDIKCRLGHSGEDEKE